MMNAVANKEKNASAATRSDDQRNYALPEVNIYETAEGYLLEAEMPGVSKEGLEVTLDDNELIITGRRVSSPLPGRPLFKESRETDFRRVFELDPAIDATKATARMEQGVLTLALPKSERVKPRKILVD